MSFISSIGSNVWILATSVGVVEVLEDQGFCRWYYALRCVNQRTKIDNDIRSSISQAIRRFLSCPETTNNNNDKKEHKKKMII
ncbi:hypothetical protein MKX01_010828 [Papaver californicum]|nr:hypothetical protein MKX01_010828 [Papaver californicum]